MDVESTRRSLVSASSRAISAALARYVREDRVVASIALAYGLFQLALIGWDQPSAIGWENDGIAPKDFLRGVFQNLAWGHAHRYPLLHNLGVLLACAPLLLIFVVAGPLSGRAIAERVTSTACMTLVSLVIKFVSVAMGVSVLLVIARIARRLFGVSAGRMAALCAASSVAIGYYGRVSNLDGPYLFWTVLALDRLLDVLQRGERRDYELAAWFIAASVATKDQAYASYVLVLLIYFAIGPLWSPQLLAAGSKHWPRLAYAARWGAIAYAVLAGAIVNPLGLLARVRLLTGTNSEDWRVYARSFAGVRRNLEDLWWGQMRFHWHWGVVAACWGGVLLAAIATPTAGASRGARLAPFAIGLSSVLFFTLPVARCEHRFLLVWGAMLCIYGGALLAWLAERRATWPLACAGGIALCLSAWQCALLGLTQWGDARRDVERFLARLPRGSVVESYGYVVFQPRFDTSSDSPYTVQRFGDDDVRTRAHLEGTIEVRGAFRDIAVRHPDVIVVSESFAQRFVARSFGEGEVPSAQWLLAQADRDAVQFFRAVVRDALPGYHRVLAAQSQLPGWARALGGEPVRVHDSTGAAMFLLGRDR